MDGRGKKGFRGLKVWHRAMDATDAVYAITRTFPGDERYALTSQLRRASSSVPMNIAERYRRKKTKADYLKFLRYADGSSAEVETGVEISARQKYIPRETAQAIIERYQEIGRMLGGLIQSIEADA